jgi:hypothetical protein
MPTVIGFDTETCEGPPITVQFYSEHLPAIDACLFVNERNVLDKSLRHLARHCTSGEYVIYGHNLKFDLLSMFYTVHSKLVMKRGEFELTHRDWNIYGVYGQPTFCMMERPGVKISFVDTYSWFTTSLAKVARLICPDLPKLAHPKGLGTKHFTKDDDHFIAYAMRDAEVAFYAGLQIDAMHKEFDLRQSVTVADMASKIFQQHYITDSAPIWNTGPAFAEGLMYSYHGGKNNVVPGATPAWHSPVDAWDLSSAYPHAMTQLPAFSQSKLFRHAVMFDKRARSFPEHGVYCVTGFAEPCDWPCIFDKDFKPIRGPFEKAWVTGYELNDARRQGEIKIQRVWGHYYDTDKDPVTDTAFARYVNDFYALKQSATDPVYRFMYKVLLNSLYGKFIQSREREADDGSIQWKHGPLHHPFAASLITGHTRGVMHRLEHETQALHTATDGVFCGARNSPKDGVFPWAPQTGLGAIESEGKNMELCMLRNKLYLLYSNNPEDGWHSFVRPGKYVAKYAAHGFQGGPKNLETLAMTGERSYEIETPNTLKMALKQNKVPNKFELRERSLNIAPISVHFNHET